jgi:peroxiredoxin
LSIGAEIPDTEFTDVQGRKFKLSDFRGKTVIIHYWATWCVPCMDEVDSLSKRLESLEKGKSAALFVSLDVDFDAHANRIAGLPRDFVFVCDGKSARGPLTSIFSVIQIPANVIISPERKLLSTKLGDALPDGKNA